MSSVPFLRDGDANDSPAFTATLLLDGKVLIAGGYNLSDDYKALATAELFDPSTDKFSPTGSMSIARTGHSATRLLDGRVLIAGGGDESDNGNLTAEIYDPVTAHFLPTGSLRTARENQTATLLKDGRVLIVGGEVGCFRGQCDTVDTVELYDPASGTFQATGRPHYGRAQSTATLLQDGRVLIVGGDDGKGNSVGRAELYDPVTGQFTLTGSMRTARMGHAATLLPNGEVLVMGGAQDLASSDPAAPVNPGGAVRTAEIYDPRTGKFAAIGSIPSNLTGHTATLLPNGQVLVAGGDGKSAFLFDPSTGRATPTGAMTVERYYCIATLLLDGRVLILEGDPAQGDNPSATTSTAEFYQP